jgi:hypothetical protein
MSRLRASRGFRMRTKPDPAAGCFLGCLLFILIVVVVFNCEGTTWLAAWLSQFLNIGR